MPLTKLIEKYKEGLRIPDDAVPNEAYKVFSQELIKSPNYRYGIKSMKKTGKFLLDNDFLCYARQYILGMITRRKAMDRIDDPNRRRVIWVAMDDEAYEKIHEAVKVFGKPQIVQDLDSMVYIYDIKIRPAINAITRELRQIYQERGDLPEEIRWLFNVGENHSQLTELDRLIVDQLIKRVKEQ